MEISTLTYTDKSQTLIGRYLKAAPGRPAILVAPDWSGVNDFAINAASRLHASGYHALVMDIYGNGKTGATKEEKNALMTPFVEDRLLLRGRLLAALSALKNQPGVDPSRIGAVGFCFGGLAVLDLARSGAALSGVASFHGLLFAPQIPCEPVKAKVLALHGSDDPMATMPQVIDFQNEMTELKADWQLHTFGNTVHAFANPAANDPEFGTVYNERSANRAWAIALQFFGEVFA